MLIIGVINVIFEQTDDVFDDAEAWRSGIGQICLAGVGLIGGLVARCCDGRVALLLALVCSCAAFAGYGTRLALLKPPPPSRLACPPPHTQLSRCMPTPDAATHTPPLLSLAPRARPPSSAGIWAALTIVWTIEDVDDIEWRAHVRSLTDQSRFSLSLTLAVCL